MIDLRTYRRFYGRTVVVNLVDGPPVRGTLWRRHGPVLVLKAAFVVVDGKETRVDGDVVVERTRVAFMQVLPIT